MSLKIADIVPANVLHRAGEIAYLFNSATIEPVHLFFAVIQCIRNGQEQSLSELRECLTKNQTWQKILHYLNDSVDIFSMEIPTGNELPTDLRLEISHPDTELAIAAVKKVTSEDLCTERSETAFLLVLLLLMQDAEIEKILSQIQFGSARAEIIGTWVSYNTNFLKGRGVDDVNHIAVDDVGHLASEIGNLYLGFFNKVKAISFKTFILSTDPSPRLIAAIIAVVRFVDSVCQPDKAMNTGLMKPSMMSLAIGLTFLRHGGNQIGDFSFNHCLSPDAEQAKVVRKMFDHLLAMSAPR